MNKPYLYYSTPAKPSGNPHECWDFGGLFPCIAERQQKLSYASGQLIRHAGGKLADCADPVALSYFGLLLLLRKLGVKNIIIGNIGF